MTKTSTLARKYIAAAKKAMKAGPEAPLFPLSSKPKAKDVTPIAGATFHTKDGLDVQVLKGNRPSVPVYIKETDGDRTSWLKINAQAGYDIFPK